jgi:two-component system chemotaxis response regulator CheY
MKILLADDSQFMRTILRTMLEKAFPGTEFLEAGTGVQAVNLWREHRPDLLLLDLVMPEKGGLEVLKDIGTAQTGKIIIISALGQDQIIEEAKSHGASAFIVKPFDEKKVVETVNLALGK